MGSIKVLGVKSSVEQAGEFFPRIPQQIERADDDDVEHRVDEVPRVIHKHMEGDDVHDDRPEEQQADVPQPRNQHEETAGKLEQFHELDIARGDERRHEMRGRRAFRHFRDGDEVEENRDTCRQEAKSQQDARDARQIFFHR